KNLRQNLRQSDGNGNTTRASDGNGNAATRSSDDGDEIERRRQDRATDSDEIERRFRSGNEFSQTQVGDDFKLGRWRSFHSSLSHGSESRSHFSTVPDTHGKSLCSSLYESQNPASTHLLRSTMIAEYVPFSGDKRYATTQVKDPPQLQKIGVFRGSTVSHGFVSKPYALHEKIPWWRRCLYLTSGSLRSLYSTQELDGVSVAVLNFLQRL
ncbi:hypothetical protein HID58_057128, partial [Brassica napus]